MRSADLRDGALTGIGISRDEALFAAEACPLPELIEAADAVRRRFFSNDVSFCGIVNARSGACSSDCRYCNQSAHYSTGAPQYPLLSPAEIAGRARELLLHGISCFGIVTSGPAADEGEIEEILIAADMIQRGQALRVSASLGMLDQARLKRLRAGGITRYHHNLETSRRFFPEICSTHAWEERLSTLSAARAAGLEICSGGLFGMGETWSDRVDLALALRELEVQSVPINFLNPFPGTPLAGRPVLELNEALRIIALYRLMLPRATLRICGGRPAVFKASQHDIFRAGANALMTGNYLTYSGYEPKADRELVDRLGMVLR